MAVHKATRSKPLAQPQPHHPKSTRRRINPQPQLPLEDPQLKAHLLETLKHVNRGFGVVLASFDKLQRQNRLRKPGIFPYDCLHDYRNRTEELRAQANRDLLRLYAEREDQDAARFGLLKRQGPIQ
jgi:hypothetical protein